MHRLPFRRPPFLGSLSYLALLSLIALMLGCGGGGGSGRAEGGSGNADFDCDGSCPHQSLSAAEVHQLVLQAVAGATVVSAQATIAVVDRVGNVLAVYQMPGASGTATVDGQIGAHGGLEGAALPASLVAISKAGTAAYLSSQGNAFSSRTASQIVQEHFDPGEQDQPGGPLFGVQFSQLICSDVTVRNADVALHVSSGRKFSFGGSIGPRPMPLGLSADPGTAALYKNGDLVGGLGIEIDGRYTLDRNIRDTDNDIEERVALIASRGFEAPSERIAPNMIIGGRSLRYADLRYGDLEDTSAVSVALSDAQFLAVPEFTNGSIRAGVPFGSVASGIADTIRAGVPASILVTPSGASRYPTHGGASLPGGLQLTAPEVDAILDSALLTAHRTRAAIRRPLDTSARVSIWVIDTEGTPLGFVRSQDAPVFGIDVALQKARTVTFFSSPDSGQALRRGGLGGYAAQMEALLGAGATSGHYAFGARSIGNLSRPYFPDGIEGSPNGPLSLPFPGRQAADTWSPFNTGAQLDLALGQIVLPVGGPAPGSIPDSCAAKAAFGRRLANGFQIFSGGVPLYRNGTLVGGIGVSGDGIFQDDLVAFYSASRQGLDFAGHGTIGDATLGFNAPHEIRADRIPLPGTEGNLRYVNCPESPFIGDNDQRVCDTL